MVRKITDAEEILGMDPGCFGWPAILVKIIEWIIYEKLACWYVNH